MPRSNARVVAALLASRAVMESVAFGCLLAFVQAIAGGREPIGLTPVVFAFLGATLVGLAVLRETASEGRGAAIVAFTLGAGVATAVLLPARSLDFVGWAGRLLAFAILAEVYLWRVLSIARGSVRWSDARNAVPFAAVALGLVALAPIPVDRGPLVVLALVLVGSAAVALSVARSTEELSLSTGPVGQARLSSANSVVFALGLGALAAAAAAPLIEQVLGDVGAQLAPVYGEVLFYALLPLGYLAAIVFAILEPLLRNIFFWTMRGDRAERDPEAEAAMIRELEQTRPFVIGGLELIVAVGVILVALVLIERAVRERRIALPEGAVLERAPAPGPAFGGMLRSLFPRRAARRRPPRDDGTPAAALRIAYWRLLALAERAGHGWRGPAATPSEHQLRIATADRRWSAAAPIVAAFEELRYGEAAPDWETVRSAQRTVDQLEAATRT